MNVHPSFALFVTLTLAAPTLAGCTTTVFGGGSGGSGGNSTSSTATAGAGGSVSTSNPDTSGFAASSGNGGAGGWTTSSATTGSGDPGACSGPSLGLPSAVCTPTATECHSQQSECIALHDNAGAGAFGLRIANLALTAPQAFTKGIVKSVIASTVLSNKPTCNLSGSGTFSWLLAFDTATGTLTTGGAKPAQNPSNGYSFVSADYPTLDGGSLHLGAVTLSSPLDASCHSASAKGDVNMPLYLDASASDAVVFPLRQAHFSSLTVSGDHNCIGKFNAVGLKPENNCVDDGQTPAYLPGGQIDAFIKLDESDTIPITQLGQTLCVLIAGNATLYGDGASPTSRCKRSNGEIVFQGDWCSTTDQPATAQCHDAVRFTAAFAASGIKIN